MESIVAGVERDALASAFIIIEIIIGGANAGSNTHTFVVLVVPNLALRATLWQVDTLASNDGGDQS